MPTIKAEPIEGGHTSPIHAQAASLKDMDLGMQSPFKMSSASEQELKLPAQLSPIPVPSGLILDDHHKVSSAGLQKLKVTPNEPQDGSKASPQVASPSGQLLWGLPDTPMSPVSPTIPTLARER